MYARERSTRGQMKSPSIAQRGEGRGWGGSGESDPLSKADRNTARYLELQCDHIMNL